MDLTPEQREAGRKALVAHKHLQAIGQKISASGHGRRITRREYLRLSRRELQATIIFNIRTIAAYQGIPSDRWPISEAGRIRQGIARTQYAALARIQPTAQRHRVC